jgi:hypothetical protein
MKEAKAFTFFLVLFIAALFLWYVVIFRGGAQKMYDTMVSTYGKGLSVFSKPIISKIFITIILFIILLCLCLATIDLLKIYF